MPDPGQQEQAELQLLLAQLLLHTACRMPQAVHGPAGQSLPQPAQAAGLMDSRCQAAAQRGGTGWDAGFWASVQSKSALLAAREPVRKHSNSGCCKRSRIVQMDLFDKSHSLKQPANTSRFTASSEESSPLVETTTSYST